MELPSYVDKLFLDLGGATPDVQKHSRQIIERIMKLGDWDAIRWMYDTSDLTHIHKVTLVG